MAHPPSLMPGKRYDLVESFDALALAGKTDGKALPDIPDAAPSFVGGFSPDRVALNTTLDAGRRSQPDDTHWYGKPRPNPLPTRRPPAFVSMPAPQIGHQSLTMQHALNTLDNTPNKLRLVPPPLTPPSRPQSDSILTTPATAYPSISASLPKPSLKVNSQNRPRAASTPVSPTASSSGKNTVQCGGVTKTGGRCSRQVKLPSTHSHLDPTPDVYCHQHRDPMMEPSGIYARLPSRPDKWIEFNNYIPQYLQRDTQLALRVEMEKTTSSSDVPGYIYTFEIRDPKRPEVIQFKVGRAVKLAKRLDEWAKQCGSKEQVVRGWWPGSVEDDDDPANGSLLRGRIREGKKGPLCHRVERLVHIELADLAVHAPYLDPKFPKVDTNPPQSGTSPKKAAATAPAPKPCPDCSKMHKEIFTFRRPKKGQFEGREWDLIVKPVIEKWGKFVADYYS